MATSKPAYNIRRLTWIARILVLAAAVGIFISSYIFYDPHYYPFTVSWISQEFSQAILYGGSLLVLAGLMWLWPGASSIIALLWVFFWFMQDFGITHTQTPLPLYFFLCGMFIVGSVIHLITAVLKEKTPRTVSKAGVWVRWAARILSLASLVAFVIALACIGRLWLFPLVAFLVIPFAGIAWFWSLPGGIFIVLGVVVALFSIMDLGYDIERKIALIVPCLILLVSGVLYLISAWMQRRRPS
jgi:peptidoglycan/LPS O-acetylase OafA/YrhL